MASMASRPGAKDSNARFLSCTCLLEPVEWACPQNTDHSTNSLLYIVVAAAASLPACFAAGAGAALSEEIGQGPGAWGLLAWEWDCGLGAAGTDNSLFLCLQVAKDCWVTPALLQPPLLACPAAVGTCALVHHHCLQWRVAGLCPTDCGGTRMVSVSLMQAVGRGWAGSVRALAPEFVSWNGAPVTSWVKPHVVIRGFYAVTGTAVLENPSENPFNIISSISLSQINYKTV